ncbi:hypothetical protein, partial [Crocosphaera sp. Alani8]|uniref:hypothetical protein n=1 Tax=Crocosphaera sp. Alani8 TaxID=3038952 RepID=UPI00313BA9B9
MSEQPLNRSIHIEKSAVGSAIVSGDGNTIYVIHQTTEQQGVEQVSPESSTEIGAKVISKKEFPGYFLASVW